MVFVSGATDSYFSSLRNLAASLRYWAPQNKLVVYNLGMNERNVKEIEDNENNMWSNVLEIKWKDGIPSHFPEHVHAGKKYAWKPIAINETLHEYHNIFWLDAGSTVVGNLSEAMRIVHQTGIFLVKGQDLDMMGRSHESTFQFLGHNKADFRAGPHFSGNTQAYLYPSRYVGPLVEANAACALVEDCISPPGSSLGNHRYDQTTMSILAYRDHLRIPHHTEFLAAERGQLEKDLFKSSFRFVWTARGSCFFYSEQEKLQREKGKGGRLPTHG